MTAFWNRRPSQLVNPMDALPGRPHPEYVLPSHHAVLGTPLVAPWPPDTATIYLGMGCFWGAERLFWPMPGVYSTVVGYQGGYTPSPNYDEICTGRTGHAEIVKVVYRPAHVPIERLLKQFWEGHDPTQKFRQGRDHGTQYRSALYWTTAEQAEAVAATAASFQAALHAAGFGEIQTELRTAEGLPFYPAEEYHQQYLAKNPDGYDCASGTGIELRLTGH